MTGKRRKSSFLTLPLCSRRGHSLIPDSSTKTIKRPSHWTFYRKTTPGPGNFCNLGFIPLDPFFRSFP